MTLERLIEFINGVIAIRNSVTDEQAAAAPGFFPEWKTDVQYSVGDKVLYGGVLYKAITAHTSIDGWAPGAAPSLWAEVLPGQDGTEIDEWRQPDSTNPYMLGDQVIHNGHKWSSSLDGNVWEPGVYGWIDLGEV